MRLDASHPLHMLFALGLAAALTGCPEDPGTTTDDDDVADDDDAANDDDVANDDDSAGDDDDAADDDDSAGDDDDSADPNLAEQSVGAAGGTVSTAAGASVEIPAGALAGDVTISVEQGIDPEALGAAALPASMDSWSTAILTPHGTSFTSPVTVTLPYGAASGDEDELVIMRLDDEADTTWEPVGPLDLDATSASFSTDGFSVYSLANVAAGACPCWGGADLRGWKAAAATNSVTARGVNWAGGTYDVLGCNFYDGAALKTKQSLTFTAQGDYSCTHWGDTTYGGAWPPVTELLTASEYGLCRALLYSSCFQGNDVLQLSAYATSLPAGQSVEVRLTATPLGGSQTTTDLTLSLNDDLVWAPAVYASGSSYDLQILTQPAGALCSIATPTGTFGTDNVAVQVDCGGGVCGNGVIEGVEECDDGALANNDGCSSVCETETLCTLPSPLNDSVLFSAYEPVTQDVYMLGRFGCGITRLDASGTQDPEFAIVGFNSTPTVLAPANDGTGDVWVAGNFSSYGPVASNRLIRLNRYGGVVMDFPGPDGPDGQVLALLSSGGRLYVGGSFGNFDGVASPYLAVLDATTGALDSTFVAGAGFGSWVHSIIEAPGQAGMVYVGGEFTSYQGATHNRVVRLDATGAVDATFTTGGTNGGIRVMAPANDGTNDIFIGGSFGQYDGATAGNFARVTDTGAASTIPYAGFDSSVEGIGAITDASGTAHVYVGGWFSNYGTTSSTRLARLVSATGAYDATFDVGTGFGGPGTGGGGAGGPVSEAVVPLPDGTDAVFVGGWFSLYDGAASNYMIKLGSDGAPLVTF